MRYSVFLLIVAIFGGALHIAHSTCVVESDFGFNVNCALKKSGLFRVRNLGGLKAHFGMGFSVGDELGFKESLSNIESNRRRSSPASKLQAHLVEAQRQGKLNSSFMVRSAAPTTTLESVPIGIMSPSRVFPPQLSQAMKKSDIFFAAAIPPFKPIPPAPERPSLTDTKTASKASVANPALMGIAVPAFSALPSSISRLSVGPTYPAPVSKKEHDVMAVVVPIKKSQSINKLSSTDFALRTLQSPNNELSQAPQMQSTNTLQAILAANNITEDMLEAALLQRQQQLLAKARLKTTTTTPRPLPTKPRNHASSVGKVMNAPREYYPVGYDKNFDDNFASRVELPDTTFYCGDQKHFPGLYADEDLGCMVFHVCALTDDGLITKSFLCPESTLFDQAILKCNWWFYVDCKNSKRLYDSNIPVSKSYQLMKALTFFSGYKRDTPSTVSKSSESSEKD